MTPGLPATCPLPLSQYPHVLMAHGGGGRLMNQLIEKVFAESFRNPALDQRHDGARLEAGAGRLAFSTDSYVVRPLFFPGGDIGTLAVNGTVNDLAMCGARPKWLSAGFIIEEGLPMETLWRVAQSMKQAAAAADVQIVTGDTKVVDRGKGDGLYLNTAGVGVIEHEQVIAPGSVQPGDVVLLSGDVGRHGMAIMSVREGLEFESTIESDCAPVAATVMKLFEAGLKVHCLRDLTRGGLSAALNEIAEVARVKIAIAEDAVPVQESVRGACEILGFDPLYVANEGRFVAIVPEADAPRALDILKQAHPEAGVIGWVGAAERGLVTLQSRIGATRILDLLSGEQLPRIC
ncbi:MAG: hydrogenase expression/formation protein HypE [Verrucomicrobia bacterium]|jgi:hydrogenase expression/formation protein HypE|nr:hydrogenase expression/formation protein HypE [Verrucomicrobiota bacterium]